jgi:hypothetical protein
VPLEVPVEAEAITCAGCGTRLEVRRFGGAIYTVLVDVATEPGEVLHPIEQLDRDWDVNRQQYMIEDPLGNLHDPTASSVGLLAMALVAGGTVCLLIAVILESAMSWLLIGVGLVIAGIWLGVFLRGKARAYLEAETNYRAQRLWLESNAAEAPPDEPLPDDPFAPLR